ELYNVNEDFSQANDLAASNPQKLRDLQDIWWSEAAKYNVLPLDWRAVERLSDEAMGRPTLGGNATTYTYYPGQIGLPNGAAPRALLKNPGSSPKTSKSPKTGPKAESRRPAAWPAATAFTCATANRSSFTTISTSNAPPPPPPSRYRKAKRNSSWILPIKAK